MSAHVLFDNLITYSLQVGMLVGVAAVVPAVLRLRQPGAKLIYWQILLAACLLLPLQPWKQVVVTGTVEVTSMVTAIEPVHHSVPQSHSIPRSEIALALVLAGVAIRLGWLASGFWKLRRYRLHSRPLDPAPAWSAEAELLISDDVASPVTFGWLKPVVLLPGNFEELDSSVREAILCHEIMHVRRADWLFTVAEEMVRAAFWFHPAIWWLLGEIGLAREQEVDRLAIEITKEREEYMDALLAIAGAQHQLDLAPAPLFLRKRHLRHRVILILKETRMSKTRLISTLTTSLAALAMVCWLVTGAFPLTAQPQVVNDAAGITVDLNGAELLHRTAVHYPSPALDRGIQGTLSVQLKLDTNGAVADAQVLSGPDELRRAALESVLEWHFSRDQGNSTRMVQIHFDLPKGVTAPEGSALINPQDSAQANRNIMPNTVEARREQALVGVPAPPPPTPPSSFRLAGVTVIGLSDSSKEQLMAALPVRAGGEYGLAAQLETNAAVSAFDQHLAVRWQYGDGGMNLTIAAPGAAPAGSVSPIQRIKVGGNVQSAAIVSKVSPAYPQLAKTARVQGVVHLQVIIAKDGTVQEIHSLGGPALLIQAAMDAVKQWVYRPTLLNGEPVTVETIVDVNFTLNE